MEFFVLVFVLLIWAGLSSVVASYAQSRGYDRLPFFLLGLFISPVIAFFIAAVLPGKKIPVSTLASISMGRRSKRCPHCAESIYAEASVCPHCHREMPGGNRKSRKPGFYYADGSTSEGPFTAEEIRDFIEAGIIADTTPIAREGEAEWRTLREYSELVS